MKMKDEIEKVPKLSSKTQLALRLYAIGVEGKEAARRANIHPQTLYKAVSTPSGKKYLEEVDRLIEEEFMRLHNKVVTTLREGLDHPDPSTKLASANLWLKYSGRYTQKAKIQVSAEDVVKQLISSSNKVEGRNEIVVQSSSVEEDE